MNTITLAERLLSCSPREDWEAMDAAKLGIADYIASSLLASFEEPVMRLERFTGTGDGDSGKSGNRIKTGLSSGGRAEDRALFNGFQAHFLDVDDVHGNVRGHPSAVILSALFAAADPEAEGIAFLESYIAGTELMARLGQAVNPDLYERGWHNTSVLGGIAAAAAVSRLRGHDEEMTAKAMGIAASRASGLRVQFGTDAKALHAGFAAASAVAAMSLAEHGFSAAPDAIFGKNGFLQVYGGDPAPLMAPFEKPWKIQTPGLWMKRHTFCSAAMAASDAAEHLRSRYAYRPEDIRQVTLRYLPGRDSALIYQRPRTGEEGRFSPEYIALLGLLGIPKERSRFAKEPVGEELLKLFSRCRRETVRGDFGTHYTELWVERTDGTVDCETITWPKGSPANPLSPGDVREKLREASRDEARANSVWKAVRDLDRTGTRELMKTI